MIKDILSTNENVKSNKREMDILHRYFPQCFNNEDKFDMIKFQSLIKDDINITNEGYDLNFLGKSYAKLIASTDTTTIIKPDLEHNSKPENINSENIYISGDNLDGLKHLLKSYSNKIKCIYIDPPYNTGTDGFVYNDNFNFTQDELVERLSINEDEANKILDLTKRGSASHSAWLMFMASRLQLAKELLTDDGVIFISIDDNEQANLKLLCDNVIFGEECFITSIPRITKRGGKSSDAIALNHDYVLVYTKTISPQFYPLNHDDSGFKYQDDYFEKRGYYKLNQTLDYDSLQYSKSLDYPIEIDGEIFYAGSSYEDYLERQAGSHDRADWAWRWSLDKFKFGYENDFIVIKRTKNGSRIYTKTYQNAFINDDEDGYYLDYKERTKGLSTLEFTDNMYSNDNATKDIAKTVGKKVFDHTKPISLISTIIDLCLKDKDIILDFFSGSATTAESVLWNNAYNKSNIRYIMVQLPESIDNNKNAFKLGYRTIDDIGMDRIKKSVSMIKKETKADIDYGFKHYTLVEPTNTTIDKLETFDPNFLITEDNILNDFGKDSVLETWLVKDGYGFGAKTDKILLDKYTVYRIRKHLYMIDSIFQVDDMVALVDLYNNDPEFNPENIVLFGYSFNFSELEMIKKNISVLTNGIKNLKINLDIRY